VWVCVCVSVVMFALCNVCVFGNMCRCIHCVFVLFVLYFFLQFRLCKFILFMLLLSFVSYEILLLRLYIIIAMYALF